MDKDKEKAGQGGSSTNPDKRLGAPMKKVDGLSSDKKRAESEHLHAFRDDINIGNIGEDE